MKLSPQQQAGLDAASSWYDSASRKPIFRFFGFAGTGKTSIAQQMAKDLGGNVAFACYTGKAAHVLREKGCRGAGTLHSLIYQPQSRSAARLRELQREYIEREANGDSADILMAIQRSIQIEQDNVKRPMFGIKEESALQDADLLVIDEVSMVDAQMGEDLLSFDKPILCLGDPAQLPPVKGGGYFTNHEPDVLLTEIHRQAAGSPILALATAVREGRGYEGAGDILRPKGQSVEFMSSFDQILVGTNKIRKVVNDRVREFRKFTSPMPQEGDRLICTRNDAETGLLNGSQWMVDSSNWDANEETLSLLITSCDNGETMRVDAHHDYFLGSEPAYYEVRSKQCFDYSYAITTHKAQGSQFRSVCIIDESHRFPAHTRKAWKYTAITRASEELTIIV
tara:strand:- start:16027 stop:17214 length:1188 start_codon:yes stop_codon:yes gene_type:complete